MRFGRATAAGLVFVSVIVAGHVAQSEAHPVISQVYGGGGNAGATYTHDFVEIFNPTDAPISLAGGPCSTRVPRGRETSASMPRT
jgi:hypothetical protein